MQKTYLYLMVCVIGAMSLASCSEDSISPDAGGDGDGDSTTEVPLAQVRCPAFSPPVDFSTSPAPAGIEALL